MNESEKNLNEEDKEDSQNESEDKNEQKVDEEISDKDESEEFSEQLESSSSEDQEEIIDVGNKELLDEITEEISDEDISEEETEEILVGENIDETNAIEGEIEESEGELGEEGAIESTIEDDLEGLTDEDTEIEESPEEEAARIQRQVREFHKCQIEASLYASGKPLSIEILSTKLEIGKKEVEELINELAFDYLERSTALIIANVGDHYQMQIKPEYTEKVSKFAEGGAIPQGILRTLTIIALKQPILKSLVIKLRGAGAYDHIKWLQEQALIDAIKKGRSHELTTTDKYSEMFGLPRDKNEMKRVMVAQLGLDEQGQE